MLSVSGNFEYLSSFADVFLVGCPLSCMRLGDVPMGCWCAVMRVSSCVGADLAWEVGSVARRP